MGFIFKGILVVIWLLVVPCLAGGFYFRREKRTCGEYLLAGYTLLFAITELLSLTMIFTKQPLHVLTVTYGVVAGVLAFLGARSLYKKRQKNRISPELVVAGILILIQLIVGSGFLRPARKSGSNTPLSSRTTRWKPILFMHIIPTPGPLTMYCQAVTFFPRFLHFLP